MRTSRRKKIISRISKIIFLLACYFYSAHTYALYFLIGLWDHVIKNATAAIDAIAAIEILWPKEFFLCCLFGLILIVLLTERANVYIKKTSDSTKTDYFLFFLRLLRWALIVGFLIKLFLFFINVEIACDFSQQKNILLTIKITYSFVQDGISVMTRPEAWTQYQTVLWAYGKDIVDSERLKDYFELVQLDWAVEQLFENCYSSGKDREGFPKVVWEHLDDYLDNIRALKKLRGR